MAENDIRLITMAQSEREYIDATMAELAMVMEQQRRYADLLLARVERKPYVADSATLKEFFKPSTAWSTNMRVISGDTQVATPLDGILSIHVGDLISVDGQGRVTIMPKGQ